MSNYRVENNAENLSAKGEEGEREWLQEKLREIYCQVGEIFYKENRDNPYLNTKYVDSFSEIKEKLEQLDKLAEEELATKGLKRCSYCHADIPIESKFCNMCGYKLFEEPEPQKEPLPKPIIKRCAWCGILLEEGAMFCGNCGHSVDDMRKS